MPQARAARRGRQRLRAGREESLDNLYAAPSEESADTGYGAPPDEAPAEYGVPDSDLSEYDNEPAASDDIGTSYGAPEEEITEEELAPPAEYGVPDDQAAYESDQDAQPSDNTEISDDAADDGGLAMLMKSVPGIPGEDYPIFAEAPETAFSCDGQVNGGKCCITRSADCY